MDRPNIDREDRFFKWLISKKEAITRATHLARLQYIQAFSDVTASSIEGQKGNLPAVWETIRRGPNLTAPAGMNALQPSGGRPVGLGRVVAA